MTKAEWLTSAPPAMLNWLEGRTSERKLRLLACACCRQVSHMFNYKACINGVNIAEDYADGHVDVRELQDANAIVWEAARIMQNPEASVAMAVGYATDVIVSPLYTSYSANCNRIALRKLCCDIFGPLLFHAITISPSVRTGDAAIPFRLAKAIYEQREFEAMPILADSLEEAGCDDQEILRHCRQQGWLHVRGCWVIDLLLGKD